MKERCSQWLLEYCREGTTCTPFEQNLTYSARATAPASQLQRQKETRDGGPLSALFSVELFSASFLCFDWRTGAVTFTLCEVMLEHTFC